MTDTTERPDLGDASTEEEIVPDYSRVGFKALRALCKDRGIPGDGTVVELIEKLKAWDVQHGKDIDLSAAENLPDEEVDEVDLLADEDDTPESPVGTGEAASPPVPTGGTMTSAAPAVVVRSDPDQPKGLPRASGQGGRADLTVKTGLVKVGEGHGAAEVRAYRYEVPVGNREITDSDHFGYIEEAHAAARRAGHLTKGGVTIGERIGFGVDADGRRTAIYQVPVKRQQ